MKILQLSVVLALALSVSASCLLKQNLKHKVGLCLIEDNPASGEFLQALCKEDSSAVGALSIVAEYKGEFESLRTLADYCRDGKLGRLNWIKYSQISERLLNSPTVNVVSLTHIY